MHRKARTNENMLYLTDNLRNTNQNGIFLTHPIGKCFKRVNAVRTDRCVKKQAPVTPLVGTQTDSTIWEGSWLHVKTLTAQTLNLRTVLLGNYLSGIFR